MENNEKHRFISASAGTGKTYWIVERVKELVATDDIDLKKILIVTYTEKAVGELKERVRKALTEVASKKKIEETNFDEASIFTIHSFCQKVLEDYPILARQPFKLDLIDEESELGSFIEKKIKSPGKIKEDIESKCADTVKNLKRDLTKAVSLYDDRYDFEVGSENKDGVLNEIVKSLYERWQKEKADRKVQTYTDMIKHVEKIVLEEPESELKKQLKSDYKGAIIDEFQDTNQFQWNIFKSLFGDDDHFLYVVGDEKQSIYSFQGADLSVFQKARNELDFDNTEKLDKNWRASKEMIAACNVLFSGKYFKNSAKNNKNNKKDNKETKKDNEESLKIVYTDTNFPKDKESPTLSGEQFNPFWIGPKEHDSYEFADFAVERIKFCCSKNNEGKTALQIPRKSDTSDEKNNLSNVNYGDFAVLARTSTEMGPIEAALKKAKIPYVRYKDKNLFNSTECQHWISLLNAINAEDFSGKENRGVLNEALLTRFFNVKVNEVNSNVFNSLSNPYRELLIKWRELAKNHQWSKLIKVIFEDTNLENELIEKGKLQSSIKFKQIGAFIVETLYKKNCSLEDVIRTLNAKMKITSDESDIVEKGTDQPCVQIMTIHASKGLEFPVVIPVAGFKGRNTKIAQAFVYYDENKNNKVLSFSEKGKDKYWKSYQEELKRLFYVAYTRAQFLMIIPQYPEPRLYKKDLAFLREAIKNYPDVNNKHPDNKALVIKNEELINHNEKAEEEKKYKEAEEEKLFKEITILNVFDTEPLSRKKHSYSSLSHPKDEREADSSAELDDMFESIEEQQIKDEEVEDNRYDAKYFTPLATSYPVGAGAGVAIHSIFEVANFSDFGGLDDYEELSDNRAFRQSVFSSFRSNGMKVDDDDSDGIVKQTASYVWNTLNASFEGKNGDSFSLKELDDASKYEEVEFNLDSEIDADMIRHYCIGFIDLMFRRKEGDRVVYYLLDWKTDTKNGSSCLVYENKDCIKKHVDEAYAIQRVLYSYCLVKWLKLFDEYREKTYEQIFEENFGGIYYVFIRGCRANSDQAIFKQTWKSWQDLENEFELIKALMK